MLSKTYIPQVPLERLQAWEKNYRSITPASLARLKNKIQELGTFKPLLAVAGRQPGYYQIIGGNQRLRAYREMGLSCADILLFPKLTDKKIILKIALADNQCDGFTEPEKLLELCQEAEIAADELTDYELADEQLALADVFKDEASSVYEDVPPRPGQGKPLTRPGDLYLLGRHRLLCADSTASENLAQLLGGEQADLLVTDPPYNVDYESASGQKIQNDKLPPSAGHRAADT